MSTIKATKTINIAFFLLLALSYLVLSCKDDDGEEAVTISDVSPTSAFPGDTITISGKHFSLSQHQNIVEFNGVKAQVINATPSELFVTVPSTAASGKISVTVDGKTAVSPVDFTVILPTQIEFSPSSGKEGSIVIITGGPFSREENIVEFNGIRAVVSTATEDKLTVIVPSGATSGKIAVTANGKTVVSVNNFTIIEPPVITSFTPSEGVIGSSLTLTGKNFNTNPALNVVRINTAIATVTSATATQLVIAVPQHATTGQISVTVGDMTTTSTDTFTVLAPSIADFTPVSGVAGTTVTINGSHFSVVQSENSVQFNGISAIIISASSTRLTVVVPSEAQSGKLQVTVKGVTVTSASDFTILSPTITGFSPTLGGATLPVIISGTNFSTVKGNNIVKFNSIQALVTDATPSRLNVTVPVGATSGRITVQVGQSTATSETDYEVCNNAELIISDIVIKNINSAGNSFTFTFRITNLGATSVDLSKVTIQNYVSKNDAYSAGDLPAGGFTVKIVPTLLATGESYEALWTSDISSTISNHPYLIVTMYDNPDGSIPECYTTNNVEVKRIQ